MVIKRFGDKKIIIRPVMAKDLQMPEKFQDLVSLLTKSKNGLSLG